MSQENSQTKPVFEKESHKDCGYDSYTTQLEEGTCFFSKHNNFSTLPALNIKQYGQVYFSLIQDATCRDDFNLLGTQLEQPCACDTKISSVRSPCEHYFRSLLGFRSESKVINFRDVEYLPGLEKQIHFGDKQKADEHLNDINDPSYFSRSYYRTCDRLLGVPEVFTVDKCSRHAKFDISEPPSTHLEMFINFDDSPLRNSLRTGCTVSECLNHIRYMLPEKYSVKKHSVLADDGTPDSTFDICKEKIQDCPAWDFESKSISIKNRPAGITSFLELDIQAYPNTTRAAVIFSFRTETRPLYEGLRFLLNGVPAMDLVYNQSSYKGFAVPLVPGRSHIARWEFVQLDDSESASSNFVELQSIILRDARVANPWETADLHKNQHIGHAMVHLAPSAPLRSGLSQAGIDSNQTAALAASLSAIAMLFSLLSGIAIACLILWLWTRHQKQKRNEGRDELGSYTAPVGFAERIAQFSFPRGESSSNQNYAPLSRATNPHIDLEAIELFENHLPSPTEDEESLFEQTNVEELQNKEKDNQFL